MFLLCFLIVNLNIFIKFKILKKFNKCDSKKCPIKMYKLHLLKIAKIIKKLKLKLIKISEVNAN